VLNPRGKGLQAAGGRTGFVAGAQSSPGGGKICGESKEGSRPTNKDFDLFPPESYEEPLRYLNRIVFKNTMGWCKITFTTVWGMDSAVLA